MKGKLSKVPLIRIDAAFRHNRRRYFGQCFLATCIIFTVLQLIDFGKQPALIASLGASSFIVFAFPHRHVSSPRYLIGGYACGIIVGSVCHLLHQWTILNGIPFLNDNLFGAMAMGGALFLMVVADLEHPPAAGVSLGLVLNEYESHAILIILAGICCLAITRTLFRPWLINLE